MEKDKRHSYCKFTITEEKEIIKSYQKGNSLAKVVNNLIVTLVQ